ncbi:MAG: polysaccharide lyase [Gammaproteobacteria bacterium]|nr:polysaccharide lyase [Gammaproteobacteria bacterium]
MVHEKWTCGNDGVIEVWHKLEGEDSYTKVLDLHGITTLQVIDGYCNSVYKKIGFYRSAANGEQGVTRVLYQDGFVEGTTFDAVVKWAHKNGGMPEF